MSEFDYKQRPWTRRLTDEEYNRAVGNTPPEGVVTRTLEDESELERARRQ